MTISREKIEDFMINPEKIQILRENALSGGSIYNQMFLKELEKELNKNKDAKVKKYTLRTA